MRRFIHILVVMAVLLVLSSLAASAFADGQITAVLPTKDGHSVKVKLQKFGEKQYLLLPSFADVKHLQLEGVNGKIVGKSGSVSCVDGQPVDLTKVIPSFKPGTGYSVTFTTAAKKQIDVRIMKSASVPAIFIDLGTTQDGKKVDYTWMNASKSNKVINSTLRKVSPEGKLLVQIGVETMKCRGKGSFEHPVQKSYSLKLESGYNLVEEAEAAKKWALVANDVSDRHLYHDRTGIYNFTARWLYKALNGKYALSIEFADLYIDGEYRGSYMITEKVEASKSRISIKEAKMETEDKSSVTRVAASSGLFLNGQTVWEGYDMDGNKDRMAIKDVKATSVLYSTAAEDRADPATRAGIRAYQYATGSAEKKSGGFILEIDFDFKDVFCWFVTRRGAAIAIKEPEYASREQVQQIAIYVQEFEDALYSSSGYNSLGKHFTEYADMDSAARYSAVDFFIANNDVFYTSTYLIVDRIDGQLQPMTFGPVWDNDYSHIDASYLLANKRAFLLKSTKSGFPMLPWVEQLFTKTEYVAKLYKVWQEELNPAFNKFKKNVLPGFISDMKPSLSMNGLVTESYRLDEFLERVQKGLDQRVRTCNSIWNDKNLKGIAISYKNKRLTVVPNGKYIAVTWYKVNEKDYSSQVVSTGMDTVFTPKESGLYFAEVKGRNLLYFANTTTTGTKTEKNRGMFSPVIRVTVK